MIKLIKYDHEIEFPLSHTVFSQDAAYEIFRHLDIRNLLNVESVSKGIQHFTHRYWQQLRLKDFYNFDWYPCQKDRAIS